MGERHKTETTAEVPANFYGKIMARLYSSAEVYTPLDNEEFVIFSDLHMGDGGSNDDFKKNAGLFSSVVSRYYLKRGYTLILNGDVEELHRYNIDRIEKTWNEIYAIFDRFYAGDRLIKLHGNHDSKLFLFTHTRLRYPFLKSIRLNYPQGEIFLFHGHQPSIAYEYFNGFFGLVLRWIANPLHIKNYSAARDPRRKIQIEKRAYDFARSKGLLAIIGHTHRPLFESLSKIDYLRFHIENLCREYPRAAPARKREIEEMIGENKLEMHKLSRKNYGSDEQLSTLYDMEIYVPCLFNSGCVIGKRGITCIELKKKEIALVHWFDHSKHKQYVSADDSDVEVLPDTQYYRLVLKRDDLEYIFARVRLLM